MKQLGSRSVSAAHLKLLTWKIRFFLERFAFPLTTADSDVPHALPRQIRLAYIIFNTTANNLFFFIIFPQIAGFCWRAKVELMAMKRFDKRPLTECV